MEFKEVLKAAKNIIVLTGAGISAESGIPTFRGAPALRWRNYEPSDLANLGEFSRNPSLVWEFYHYRREICLKASPNDGHLALVNFEKKCKENNKAFTLITQNVDGLHRRAGSENIISIHGELFQTKCMKCKNVLENYDSPICEALMNRGSPVVKNYPTIPIEKLPHCTKCNGLLRPNVVWFGENLRGDDLRKAYKLIDTCDLCLVIGTSAVVQPVAQFPLQVLSRGVAVAEFNLEKTEISDHVTFFFKGPSGVTLKSILDI